MIPANRQIHAKLEIIRPNGTWVDVTEYLESVDVELGSIERMGTEATGADIGVRTLSFTLRNDGQRVKYWDSNTSLGDSNDNIGDAESVLDIETIVGQGQWARNSFAPRDRTSAWNLVNGQWVPLLWPYREVILEVSATAPGETPNWVTLFEGYMGDDISTEGHSITVTCRDKSKRLMDAYIDVAKTYEGPMSPEDLIQAIINDYVESPPTLYCPIPSGMTFEKMTVEYASVWDAIQNVATQTGWFLGYRWNGQAFVLTFLEPPRGRNTPDFEFNWEDDIYHETLNVSDKDIRNALTISFRDSTTGERRTLSYQDYPELRNDASKEEYGGLYRIMQIEEADTSLIDTEEKALAFGEKCIWDLSELSATDRLNLPLLPELDLFSTFTVENPLTSSTKDFYAVQSIRHTLSFGESGRFRTEVIATGRVVGAKTKWQDMETRPGRPGDPNQKGKDGSGVTMAFKRSETKPDTPMPSGGMPPGWYADVESTTGSGPLWATVGTRADSKSFWIWQEPVKMEGEDGEDFVPPKPATPVWAGYTLTNVLTVNWHIAEHASDYEIRENLNWGNAVGLVFRGYAHSLSFIPKSREFILYLRALNAAGEYSDGYAILTVSLPAPSPPSQPDVEAYFSALKIRPVPLASPSVMGYYVYISGDGISDKVPVVAGGSLTYPLPSGTTVVIQVSAYDILGEGGKSQPLQATTTHLDRADFPEWVKQPLDNIAEQWVTETDENGNIIGLVKVEDGARDGHIAILADAFSIATPEGRQQIFVFDTQDKKLYLVGDLVAEGLIRATEVQAEVAKALLMQAELGVFDEIHGLRIRADKITVGGGAPGLVTVKPSNSHLWHFDNSLQSTQGLAPVSGSATLVEAGKFGGGVVVQSSLRYDTDVGSKHTVACYRATATWQDYANLTWSQLENLEVTS